MQDVIEHLVVRYEPIPGGGAESADPEAIRTSIVNVQIVEIVYVRALADIPKITDLLLNMLVPDSLRNISIKFRECTPDDVHRGLRDPSSSTLLQQNIIRLSPKCVIFHADTFGNGHRMSITAARSAADVLEQSFPELYRKGIAKTVLPKGERKFLKYCLDCP